MKFVANPSRHRRKAPSPRNLSCLQLNLKELFHARGIPHPYAAMRKLGFSHSVAFKLLKGTQVLLKNLYIEKICIALWCTPNDLYRLAGNATGIPPGHPLHSLNRTLTEASLASELAEMSLDHLRILKKVAAELKSGKLAEG